MSDTSEWNADQNFAHSNEALVAEVERLEREILTSMSTRAEAVANDKRRERIAVIRRQLNRPCLGCDRDVFENHEPNCKSRGPR